MPRAILKSPKLSLSAIDETTGVISGCKLFQVGGVATFKGADGKVRSFERTPEVAAALLSHAGNRSIPAHFTHDYDDTEGLPKRLGLHKNLRIDADGDLASDLHTMPNEYGRLAMWTAKTDPTSAAFSAVFGYNEIKDGSRTLAVPTSFDAADFVSTGAACDAMLSKFTENTDMTKEEIQAIVSESIKAALAEFKPTIPANLITSEEADTRVKAALSAHKVELSDEQKAEVAKLAEASMVAKIGSGALQLNIGDKKGDDEYTAALAEYRKTAPNQATAVARLLKDKPHLAAIHEEHTRTAVAKLTGALTA